MANLTAAIDEEASLVASHSTNSLAAGAAIHALPVQVFLPNKLKIQTRIDIPAEAQRRCVVYGHGSQYSVEATHDCIARQVLFERLCGLLPSLLRPTDIYSFRTLNGDSNPTANCLFDGIQLELRAERTLLCEYGFCFPRTSFVKERDSFVEAGGSSSGARAARWKGWQHREPADSDRLRINKRGNEILYFVQPPGGLRNVTITMLRSELAASLGIADPRRIMLTAGPFVWDPSFEEDERDVCDTYFHDDIVVDSRHMRTFNGAALIYVLEI